MHENERNMKKAMELGDQFRARKTILDLTSRIYLLEQAAELMRDAMRHRPETWNHAIDYYETLPPPLVASTK
jgi:hypothetical protein